MLKELIVVRGGVHRPSDLGAGCSRASQRVRVTVRVTVRLTVRLTVRSKASILPTARLTDSEADISEILRPSTVSLKE